MPRLGQAVALAVFAFVGFAVGPPLAEAASFTNPAPITIPGGGMASPYPSTITTSGVGGIVTDVNVTLHGYTHPNPTEVGILLLGPQDQFFMPPPSHTFAILAGGSSASDAEVTLDDSGAGLATGALGGTYKPTNCCNYSYPPPGPEGNYYSPPPLAPAGPLAPTFASTFKQAPLAGTWELFVYDFVTNANAGQIARGWTLELAGDNHFQLGIPRIAKNRRSATLPVTFPGPGFGIVADATHFGCVCPSASAKRKRKPPGALLQYVNPRITGPGTIDLPITPSRRALGILRRKGRVRLPVRVVFLPTDSIPGTSTITITLKRRK